MAILSTYRFAIKTQFVLQTELKHQTQKVIQTKLFVKDFQHKVSLL